MNIDLGSFAYGSTLENGVGTPSWGTSLGQGHPEYYFTRSGYEEIVTGMVYCSVPLNRVSLPLGKGGRVCNCLEAGTIQIASVFNKVFVNGESIQYPFIMVLLKEESNSHFGRRSIKYTDKATYEYQKGIYYTNKEFVNHVYQKFDLSSSACWFVYDIDVKNHDELHIKAIFVNKKENEEYQDSHSRGVEWIKLIENTGDEYNVVELNMDKTNKIKRNLKDQPLQQIYYGAPGTGKSHEINDLTKLYSTIRTTFHPDSDYSTFVGAYKPTMEETPVYGAQGVEVAKEKRITYTFVKQAFLKAYLGAWQKYAKGGEMAEPQFLVIEEINRGNCAQIFGDLFQLLDRSDNGFSTYPIEADSDLQSEIKKAFAEGGEYAFGNELDVDDSVDRYTSNYGETLSDDIKSGRVLLLPNNLYIWASMNTSDQSLFPIDSAFKRRWDWRYVKITDAGKGWKIKCGTEYCDWWTFVEEINKKIAKEETSSDDKKLGYFFCKPPKKDDKIISEEKFVGKVLFYLWNDVFKDGDISLFKVSDEPEAETCFDAFYGGDGKVNVEAIRKFLVNVVGEDNIEKPEAKEEQADPETE